MEKENNSFTLFKASFLMTIVFIVLKLGGTVSWSWFLVFLPLIIYAGFHLVLISLILLLSLIVFIFD